MLSKLDHHHRATLERLFAHPLTHNIKWRDVCALLERVGVVHETHRGNWAVTVDGVTISFGPTRTRDLTEEQVVKVRNFLRSLGLAPVRESAA